MTNPARRAPQPEDRRAHPNRLRLTVTDTTVDEFGGSAGRTVDIEVDGTDAALAAIAAAIGHVGGRGASAPVRLQYGLPDTIRTGRYGGMRMWRTLGPNDHR